LNDQIEQLNTIIETWDDTTRTTTMAKKAEAFKMVRFKVECHRQFLQSQAETLETALNDAVAKMLSKIDSLEKKEVDNA